MRRRKEIKLSAECSIDFFVCALWTFMKATSAPICMLIFFGIQNLAFKTHSLSFPLEWEAEI